MRTVELFVRAARSNLKKIALISERNQLTFEDLLFLTHSIEAEVLSRGLRQGDRVLLTTGRAEFIIAMWMIASRRSLELVLGRYADAHAAGLDYDLVIGTEAPEDGGRSILIEPTWFDALGTG